MSKAWQNAVDRVTLNPAWPLITHLDTHTSGIFTTFTCAISTLDARADLADLSGSSIDVQFSSPPLTIDTDPEALIAIIKLLHTAAWHELAEFLYVNGQVAAPPHAWHSPAPIPILEGNEAWQSACASVALHATWKLDLKLSADADAQGNVKLTCDLRGLGETTPRWIFNKLANTPNSYHIEQLLGLVKNSISSVLDACINIDGAPLNPDLCGMFDWETAK